MSVLLFIYLALSLKVNTLKAGLLLKQVFLFYTLVDVYIPLSPRFSSKSSISFIYSVFEWPQLDSKYVLRRSYTNIQPVWSNRCVFVWELSGSYSKSTWSHLTFRFCACFEHRVLWHSGNYTVWIHSETRTWHGKNIQSFLFLFWSVRQW